MSDTRQRIYITGYPRSGNTWLGRLLANILDCEYNSFDGEVGDWPGAKSDAPYLVRKTHDLETPDAAHTVFIYRDPRDVAVSKMYYARKANLTEAINDMMGSAGLFGVGPYLGFMQAWWYSHKAAAEIRYEDLHATPYESLHRVVLAVTGNAPDDSRFKQAIKRQAFSEIVKRYHDAPTHPRKGIVGDWRNHFTPETGRLMHKHFGKLLIDQGYEINERWPEALAHG